MKSEQAQSRAMPREEAEARADLAAARRVLDIEAAGLNDLSAALGDSFTVAVDLLVTVAGRIVVTGMGKSGHIGRKIAATLASTGSPAFFVHPAEASHGDLGMIKQGDDAIIALSNSGETTELADVVDYAKRFEIPLIAMTARGDSALADAADAALVLPASAEACPMGLAPTTSTTMMLALGDAVAVALMERKGHSSDSFHVLHPGGKLGRRLLKVAEIMHVGDEIPLVSVDTSMSDALLAMTAKSFGCVGVVDSNGRLAGIITDGDLRRHIQDDLLTRRADAVMTRSPRTIGPETLASEALHMMNAADRPFTNLFVVVDGCPVGILHIHDCLRAGVA
jgi:arabinose-5-phosphate isomerase